MTDRQRLAHDKTAGLTLAMEALKSRIRECIAEGIDIPIKGDCPLFSKCLAIRGLTHVPNDKTIKKAG